MPSFLETLQNALRGTYNGMSQAGEDMAKGIADAATLPRDVYRGDVNLNPSQMSVRDMTNDDLGRVLNMAGNVAGGGITTGSAPAGSLGMFAGQTARGAPARMEQALALGEKHGLTPEQIYQNSDGPGRTGIFRGNDGVPRFEFSDVAANADLYKLRSGQGAQLMDVLDHPELYKHYPELARMPVEDIGRTNPNSIASYRGGETPRIGINSKYSDQEATGYLLHEVQHAIQEREAFSPGANPAMDDIVNAKPIQRLGTAADRASLHAQRVQKEAEAALAQSRPSQDVLADLRARLIDAKNADNQASFDLRMQKHLDYARAGGEVEARTTQERQYLGLAQRKQQVPTEWARNTTDYGPDRINMAPSEIWHPGTGLPYPLNQYPRGWMPVKGM